MKTQHIATSFLLSIILLPGLSWAGNFYAHLGAGIGMDFFSSSDIEDDLPGYTINNLGFPLTLVGRLGYSNIFQAEYRKKIGGADHSIESSGFSTASQFDMNYDENDVLFKLNPFFTSWNDDQNPFYLVFGSGDITYEDNLGDGYEGDATVLGLEWTHLTDDNSKMLTYSLKHVEIEFDEGFVPEFTGRTYEAMDLIFEMTFSLGFSF
jgi:hypothetical protein